MAGFLTQGIRRSLKSYYPDGETDALEASHDVRLVSMVDPKRTGLRCHKAVLAARSDVFAAMFSHKATTESTTNEVHIRDTEPDILEQLLNFVYTDKVMKLT